MTERVQDIVNQCCNNNQVIGYRTKFTTNMKLRPQKLHLLKETKIGYSTYFLISLQMYSNII